MIKKQFILLNIIAIFFSIFLYSQQDSGHLHCGYQEISYKEFQKTIKEAENLKAEISVPKFRNATNEISYIPIKVHLLGKDDGTGYADENAINNMLALLNKSYKKHLNIEFYFAGTAFKKYQNSKIYNSTSDNDDMTFHHKNGVYDAINLYVQSSVQAGNAGYAYNATYRNYSTSFNRVHITKGYLNNKTASHEFGHYFGLLHTFQNSNHGIVEKRELVTRNPNETNDRKSANCSTTGDFFCDTEADPYGRPNVSVSKQCTLVTQNRDANGDIFHPNMDNYMNYYFCHPNPTFTSEQIEYMKKNYLLIKENTTYFNAPETPQNPPTELKVESGAYNGEVEFSWQDNSDEETGYIIEVAEEGTNDFFPIGGVRANTTSYKTSTSLDITKKYVYRVKPSNSSDSYSQISSTFSVGNTCIDNSPCERYVYINNFSISNKNKTEFFSNNQTNCTGSVTTDYSNSHSIKVYPKEELNFTASFGSKLGYVSPPNFNLYIDWDRNGSFESNEIIYAIENGTTTIEHSFKIKDNLSPGKYRVRAIVSILPIENTCKANYGEIEDYALIIPEPQTEPTLPFTPAEPIIPEPEPENYNGRVGINTTQPEATLHIKEATATTSPQGVLFPSFTNEDIKKFENVTEGTMIFNSSEKCLQIYIDNSFKCLEIKNNKNP